MPISWLLASDGDGLRVQTSTSARSGFICRPRPEERWLNPGRDVRAGISGVMSAQIERPGAEEWVPERPSLKGLRAAVQECRGCELHQEATQAVMGAGRARAELLVLGEQPGDQEDRAGKPFVGPAGKLLDRALAEAGIEPDSVYRTNVVKHFRFERRGKQRIHKGPSRVHVAACGHGWWPSSTLCGRPEW